jgi:PTH2 family peptidyl-tRNA hydrolase
MFKQVIVIRKDLNMRKGKMIAQACHGAVNLVMDILKSDNHTATNKLYRWMENDYKKICLGVNSEEELIEICRVASVKGIPRHLVIDNGLTEFHGVKTTTCVVLGPWENEELDEVTGGLTLL